MAQRLVDGLGAGRHLALRTGDADEFYDYKPYSPGDPIARVDWRAAARRDDLHIRRRRHEAPMTVAIAVDTSESMGFRSFGDRPWPTKLRAALEVAAALAAIALRQGDRVAIVTDGSEIATSPLVTGREGLARIAHSLSSVTASGAISCAALLRAAAEHVPSADLVIAVSDALEELEGFAEAVAQVSKVASTFREVMLIQVLSDDELAAPPVGATLVDPESGMRHAVGNGDAAEQSRAQIAAHIEQVRQIIRHARGRYELHRTAEPVATTLRRLLAAQQ